MENWQDISKQKCSPSSLEIRNSETFKRLQEEIMGRIDLTRHLEEEELEEVIDKELLKDEKVKTLNLETKKLLRQEIFYAIRRLGILQELLADSEVTEVMVNGTEPIFVEKGGKLQQLPVRFDMAGKLNHVIQQIVADCNRVVNEASPIVDARLKDGSRVNVVLAPVAINGPILTIRRFPEKAITMKDLVAYGSVTEEVSLFLEKLVIAGYNILVSGATGCGKTTFLNVLSGFIPENERVITIEDSAELQLARQPNLVRLETRNAEVEGCREITIRDLIKTSLRMRPDRIIVGEVRGKEAVDMLQSVNVGHNAMTTVHANSVRDVVSRLETMVLMGMELPLLAIRKQITAGFDLMIHLAKTRDGKRRVMEIAEPVGVQEGEVRLNTLYLFEESEINFSEEKAGTVMGSLVKKGELQHVEKLKAAGYQTK